MLYQCIITSLHFISNNINNPGSTVNTNDTFISDKAHTQTLIIFESGLDTMLITSLHNAIVNAIKKILQYMYETIHDIPGQS